MKKKPRNNLALEQMKLPLDSILITTAPHFNRPTLSAFQSTCRFFHTNQMLASYKARLTRLQIVASKHHNFILTRQGKLLGWGFNSHGQLGSKVQAIYHQLNEVMARNIEQDVKIKAVTSGYHHLLMITERGHVLGCGSNEFNQLGLNNEANRELLMPIPLHLNKEIICSFTAGGQHTLFYTHKNHLYGCGDNAAGQLGFYDSGQAQEFIRLSFPNLNPNEHIKAITAGNAFSIICTTQGRLFACGQNLQGQLGLPEKKNYCAFTAISIDGLHEGEQPISVTAGGFHCFIITNQGRLFATGDNRHSQLGLGHANPCFSFKPVSLAQLNEQEQPKCLALGSSHTLLLTNQGRLFSCGNNQYGQLGLDDTTPRTRFTEVKIADLNPHEQLTGIAAGQDHSLLATTHDRVLSCGSNLLGQLGFEKTTVALLTFLPCYEEKEAILSSTMSLS